jgi:hypothetical protein
MSQAHALEQIEVVARAQARAIRSVPGYLDEPRAPNRGNLVCDLEWMALTCRKALATPPAAYVSELANKMADEVAKQFEEEDAKLEPEGGQLSSPPRFDPRRLRRIVAKIAIKVLERAPVAACTREEAERLRRVLDVMEAGLCEQLGSLMLSRELLCGKAPAPIEEAGCCPECGQYCPYCQAVVASAPKKRDEE